MRGGEMVPICEVCGIPYGPDHEHVDLMAQFFANGGELTMTDMRATERIRHAGRSLTSLGRAA